MSQAKKTKAGRPPLVTPEKKALIVSTWLETKESHRALAKRFSVSQPTISRILKALNDSPSDSPKPSNTQRTIITPPPVCDPACGGKSFYSDKTDPRVIFSDIRRETHILCDERKLQIDPDLIADFRRLPYPDKSFWLVVFDPPHMKDCGEKSWMRKKYGRLGKNWRADLAAGFSEAWRVLKPCGTLIFKWNQTQIPLAEVLRLAPANPLLAQAVNKESSTYWAIFFKLEV